MRLVRPGLMVVCAFLFAFVAFTGSASAATVTVGCAGTAPAAYNFTSVTAALNSLAGSAGNVIVISGTCHETIDVTGFRYLTLTGTPGATLTAPAPNVPMPITLSIRDGVEVTVENLSIEGPDGSVGVAVSIGSSTADIRDTRIENATVGVSVDDSTVHFTRVLVQDNSDGGVSLSHSRASFDNTETEDAVSSTIQRSGVGIDAGMNSVVNLWGGTTIRDNDFGVQMSGSSLTSCCLGVVHILQNGAGIRLTNGSTAELRAIDIEGNSSVGLQMIGSTARLLSRHTISNNSGGFGVVVRSSHLEVQNGHIDNNGAFGLVVRESGSVHVQNETITGNGTGIQLSLLSTASILSGSVTGNGQDLVCSPESVAVGSKASIGSMHCPSFGVDPLPGPTQ